MSILVDVLLVSVVNYWHAFGYSHLLHLDLDPLDVIQFSLLLHHYLQIFFPLFLIDLFLQSILHFKLFLFSFVLDNVFFVSSLLQDVAIPLQLQINPILYDSASDLHI